MGLYEQAVRLGDDKPKKRTPSGIPWKVIGPVIHPAADPQPEEPRSLAGEGEGRLGTHERLAASGSQSDCQEQGLRFQRCFLSPSLPLMKAIKIYFKKDIGKYNFWLKHIFFKKIIVLLVIVCKLLSRFLGVNFTLLSWLLLFSSETVF